jgi:hypothetical protein
MKKTLEICPIKVNDYFFTLSMGVRSMEKGKQAQLSGIFVVLLLI